MMATEERALVFGCEGEQLLGIVSSPAAGTAPSGTAVLIVVGGPQYRAGAHRQFVQLARALAAAGHTALRFDHRGMGDSSGAQRGFENIASDIRCALDALQSASAPGCRLVIFGLCDGASAALLYLHKRQDSRVQGLVLLNPWVRSDVTLARAHLKHYYLQRLREPEFWRKLASGGVGWLRFREMLQSLAHVLGQRRKQAIGSAGQAVSFQVAMAQAWRSFEGRILLLACGDDLTAQEFLQHSSSDAAWRGLIESPRVARVDIPGADHTLSDPQAQRACEGAVRQWLTAA